MSSSSRELQPVIELQPSKENLLQHRSCGPAAHRLRVRVQSGHDFFLPSVIMYAGFVIYMLMGIKICDLYTFIKSSYSRVFKLANVCNIYDLYNCFFFLQDLIFFSAEGQALTC